MTFKPVGVDENSNFPTRVVNKLKTLFPPLDGSGKVPEANIPSRLSDTNLSSTYASNTALALKAKLDTVTRPSVINRTNNPPRNILQLFQAGHGYGTAGTSSYNMNDTTDFTMGTQSAYIVSAGAGASALIGKQPALSTAVDMTGKIFAIQIKITNVAHLKNLVFYAGSNTLANYFTFNIQSSLSITNQEIYPDGRWVWVTIPWDNPSVTGTPSRSAITDLRCTIIDDNTGQLVKLQIQAIATQQERPAAFPNGVVSIGFDDLWGSQKLYGTSYMDKYGFSPTIYSIIDNVGTAGRLSLTDMKRIEEYSGGEVAAHAWSTASHNVGFDNLDPTQLDNELRWMKEWLIDNNFQGRDLLAYPLGQFNSTVLDTATKYYRFARTISSRHQETLPAGGSHTCRAQSSTNTTPLATITAAVDNAYANGTWLNLLYHDITTGIASASVQVTQANFQAAIDYIATKGIPVRTVSQVLRVTVS